MTSSLGVCETPRRASLGLDEISHVGTEPTSTSLCQLRLERPVKNSAGMAESPEQVRLSKESRGPVPPCAVALHGATSLKQIRQDGVPGWVRSVNLPGVTEPPCGPGEWGPTQTNSDCGPQPRHDSSAQAATGMILTNVPQVPAIYGYPRLAGPSTGTAPDQYGCRVDRPGPGDGFGASQRTAKRSRGRRSGSGSSRCSMDYTRHS